MTVLTGWQFDPFFIVPAVVVTWAYLAAVRKVRREHPTNPVPTRRVVYFLLGMAALVLAIMSPIASYDTDLFALHMVQHLLIIMVAAPLLLLGAPITLILRVSSPRFRKGVVLPLLHSRVVRGLAFPVVAWGLLAAVMWISHFSSLFDAALEHTWLHYLEHALYMVAALLFWWPVTAADPAPWRLGHPIRLLYVFLQMPQNSFLAVAIYSSNNVIFPHYETLARTWGPSPLTDQHYAGLIMWLGGDALFLIALACLAFGWVQAEDRASKREDRRLARERAAAAAK
jgi:putative copper resistance protein D